ncbi:hypothetical protein L5515_004182 [Caenorhabditis briggsae]|uniref:Uncharacterized protein n=1 Tax=Caenorhabditis briggsae TaxID=6238 RepID=A0AAE9EP93_CAEBR|nr:hypothetical protein L5515_004182 [Caenorhabditis briggsae]
MPDDDEAKKKMRVRIERDSYSVLLSFKDGATPRQVEQRMDDTLGYTYNSKYHLAGVHDMFQILNEHKQVQLIPEGKFKIIATEENHELVALIAKQKDKKRNKGKGGKGGRRAVTSMGHNRNGFGQGLTLRSSPKPTAGMRLSSSMTKTFYPKASSNGFNVSRPSSSAANTRTSAFPKQGNRLNNFSNRQFMFDVAPKPLVAPKKYPPQIPPSPQQRPLMRPSTSAASVSSMNNSILDSSWSDATLAPSSPKINPASRIPSIKEFTDNAKRMMLRMYPESIHLSEMTDRYCQEYGVTIEPLQIFSKSWMLLVKTTFKEFLQINEGQVSMKEDWYRKYGSVLSRSLPVKPIIIVPKPNPPEPSKPFLPSNQGFRYQIPTRPKSPEVIQKMRGSINKFIHYILSLTFSGLTVGNRLALHTPEKPPGISLKASMKSPPKHEVFFSDPQKVTRVQHIEPVSSGNTLYDQHQYDARHLQNLKHLPKSKEMVRDIQSSLSGKGSAPLQPLHGFCENSDQSLLKKNQKKASKQLGNFNDLPPIIVTRAPDVHVIIHTSPVRTSTQVRSSSLPSPPTNPLRTRSTGVSSRLFGRALGDIKKQNETKQISTYQRNELDTVAYDAPITVTYTRNDPSPSKNDSDDGWGSPLPSERKFMAPNPVKTTSKMILPPMSKGSCKDQARSRSVSVCKSVSSQDGTMLEKALDATLPDDGFW